MQDPQLGRWHCPDALGEMYASTSPYAYCGNDPVNFTDFAGLARTYNYATGQWEGKRGYDGDDWRAMAGQFDLLGGGGGSSFPKMCAGLQEAGPGRGVVDDWFASGAQGKGVSLSEFSKSRTQNLDGSISYNYTYWETVKNIGVNTYTEGNTTIHETSVTLDWVQQTGTYFSESNNIDATHVNINTNEILPIGQKRHLTRPYSMNGIIPQIETSLLNNFGAVTPGFVCIYPEGKSSDPYFNTHEPGHAIQFLIIGPIPYITLVAVPSLISAGLYSQHIITYDQYVNLPWEKSANTLWYWFTGEYSTLNPVYFK